MIKVGIDASNIKAGGGLTHLLQLLEHANPMASGIEKVIIWGGDNLKSLPEKEWLIKRKQTLLTKSFLHQSFWKLFKLPKLVKECDILFVPGGTFSNKKIPYVSMSQNMLVFEKPERDRFPFSFTKIRYLILNQLQTKSFKNASGIIFISNYAKNFIRKEIDLNTKIPSDVIYHGISEDFRHAPKNQQSIGSFSENNPYKILYVSIINFYKHQWNVVKAVKSLREKGHPVELILIGPSHPQAMPLLEREMKGAERFVTYAGKKSYKEIAGYYKQADMFLFASTCENMPNILVEAMSAGLPIVSSHYGPMREILKDAGEYFDPLNSMEIESALKKLIEDQSLRKSLADKAFNYSQEYTWTNCALKTFDFIAKVYKEHHFKIT